MCNRVKVRPGGEWRYCMMRGVRFNPRITIVARRKKKNLEDRSFVITSYILQYFLHMKRESWIDNMKGIAILAVVFDHAFYIFPQFQNHYIWQHTFFSIPWFVFLAAVTNTLSFDRKKWIVSASLIPYWIGRIRGVLLPYVFASVFIYLFYHLNTPQPVEMLNQLVNFSAQPTYYFVNLLLQLYFVFPFLYILVVKIQKKWLLLPLILAIFLISFRLFTISDHLPWPFYSLGAVFGGSYFFLFFLGILYGKKILREDKLTYLYMVIIFMIYEFVMNTSRVFFLRSINIHLFIWSAALFFIVKKGIEIFPRQMILTYTLGVLGKYSLFIYLFHYFFLEQAAKYLPMTYPFFFPGIVVLAILFSLIIGFIYRFLSGSRNANFV